MARNEYGALTGCLQALYDDQTHQGQTNDQIPKLQPGKLVDHEHFDNDPPSHDRSRSEGHQICPAVAQQEQQRGRQGAAAHDQAQN